MSDPEDTIDYNPPAKKPARVPSADVHVEVGGLSHIGKVRDKNEDHFLVARFGRTMDFQLTNLPEEYVPAFHAEVGYGLVVADGMGGAAGGEIASRSAIQDLTHLVLTTPDWIMHGQSPWVEEVMQRMAQRFRDIDQYINLRAVADPTLSGMGTTMTLAANLGLDMVICHIGDSRAYLFRRGKLSQLTRDMTMAQELIAAGTLSPEQAATYRFRHVLTQCLGGPGMAKAEVQHISLETDDRILLCTDGLYDMVRDEQIAEILKTHAAPQECCQVLVDRALVAGGRDNITVALARYRHVGKSA